jgi:hypothetical protein
MGPIERSDYDEPPDNNYQVMKEVVNVHGIKQFLESDEGAPFFLGENDEIGCMDGRVKPEGALGLAGSGILLPRGKDSILPEQKYLDILAKRATEGKLKVITWHRGHDESHGGCGAAKLFMKNQGYTTINEDAAAQTAKNFAEALAFKLSEMSGKKIIAKEAPGEGDHSEVGSYFDMTDSLDLISQDESVNVQLPNMFMHNPRLTQDPAYLLEEVKVAIKIAFSDHGKNGKNLDYFTKENPFSMKWVESIRKPLTNEEKAVWGGFPKMVMDMIKKEFPSHADKIADMELITVPH